MSLPTVILANGKFPRRGTEAYRLLSSASRVIACDGAADEFYHRLKRLPNYVVGDLDSVSERLKKLLKPDQLIHVAEQETNDLEKAIAYSRGREWNDIVIVGATGKREDHSLGNIFRAMQLKASVITECGVFEPFGPGTIEIAALPGSPISIFATDPKTKMKSIGLEWPLDNVKFSTLYCATLNRATSHKIEITSTRPAFIFKPFDHT